MLLRLYAHSSASFPGRAAALLGPSLRAFGHRSVGTKEGAERSRVDMMNKHFTYPDRPPSWRNESEIYNPPDELKPFNLHSETARHPFPTVNTKLFWLQYDLIHENFRDPDPVYCAVNHNGCTYHLFNAKRYTLGRMSSRISQILQGKHKPTMESHRKKDSSDKVVIVNAGDIKVTGRKRYQKYFVHHTRYPGGIKEIQFRDLMNRHPDRLMRRVIGGMLPKNKTRKSLLENLIVHAGPMHNQESFMLPQMIAREQPDPNLIMGRDSMSPETHAVIYESHPDYQPEELKDYRREYDGSLDRPFDEMKKTHSFNPKNVMLSKYVMKKFRRYRKYKEFK